MNYDVVLSMDAVEDVLRITIASGSKSEVIRASRQIQEALRSDPAAVGEHLSEGFYRRRGSHFVESRDVCITPSTSISDSVTS